jgi:hypothetical protein
MRQGFQRLFQLDRISLPAYLGHGVGIGFLAGLVLLAPGCRPAPPGPVVPFDVPVASAEQVAAWVRGTVPSESRLHRFKWLFQDERASAGGRGSARIAPPDSLRFDAAGPFGSEPTAAVVVGDRPQWMEPPDPLERMVPNYPLLWAMFGVARPPEAGAALRGVADGSVTAWQYAGAVDTVEYRYTRDAARGTSTLVTEARHAGKVVGRAETTMGTDGAPRKARLVVPSVPAKLDLTFDSTTRTTFAPDIWLRRTP